MTVPEHVVRRGLVARVREQGVVLVPPSTEYEQAWVEERWVGLHVRMATGDLPERLERYADEEDGLDSLEQRRNRPRILVPWPRVLCSKAYGVTTFNEFREVRLVYMYALTHDFEEWKRHRRKWRVAYGEKLKAEQSKGARG